MRSKALFPDFGIVIEGSVAILDTIPIDEAQDLAERHGVILFRVGAGLDAFKAFSNRICGSFSNYKGGGLRFGSLDRNAIGGDETVLTVTGHGQGFGIPLHGEMYYMPRPPEWLWFFCEMPARMGGQTTVGSARTFHGLLKPSTRDFFTRNAIRYRRVLGTGDWPKTFLTDRLDEAERFCRDQGFEWSYDPATGKVCVEFVTGAIRHDRAGVAMFMNNILVVQAGEDAFKSGWAAQNLGISGEWPFVVRTETGDPLPSEILLDLRRAEDEVTRNLEWQPGDFALVDNRSVLHGRRATDDKGRMILVRLADSLGTADQRATLSARSS
jgi:alpha-ketoglutarate-dependent taurine dioxygenase